MWLRLDGELDEKPEKGKPQVHLQAGKAGLDEQPRRVCLSVKIRFAKPPGGGGGTNMDTEEEVWWLKQENEVVSLLTSKEKASS